MTNDEIPNDEKMTNDEIPNDEKMTNDSSSQFSCSRIRETLGTYANAQTLTSSATTIIRLTPNWEVLSFVIHSSLGISSFVIHSSFIISPRSVRNSLISLAACVLACRRACSIPSRRIMRASSIRARFARCCAAMKNAAT